MGVAFLGNEEIIRQDGGLEPAYCSSKYKYFDQLLQTVKNKTQNYCFELIFEKFFTNINSTIDVYTLCKRRGYHDFPLKNFCLTVLKHFVEKPFCVSENFWNQKILWIRGRGREGVSRFSVENFLSHSTENFRRGTLLCLRKILASKNVKDERVRVSRFSVGIVLSHSTDKFHTGTPPGVRKFLVP